MPEIRNFRHFLDSMKKLLLKDNIRNLLENRCFFFFREKLPTRRGFKEGGMHKISTLTISRSVKLEMESSVVLELF